MDAVELALLLVVVVIVLLVFYASAALVSQDWSASPEHLLRLLVVSLVFVFVVSAIGNMSREHVFSDLLLLLSFVVLVVVVRFVLVGELAVSDDWLASMIVSLIGVTLIFMIDILLDALLDLSLPSIV
jgi:hypothetical protein